MSEIEELKALVMERNDWLVGLARASSGMEPDTNMSNAPEYVKVALERINAMASAPEGWRMIGWRNHSAPNGLRRIMTPKQYIAQTDGVKKWYEPVYCAPTPEGWRLVPVAPTSEMLTIGAIYPDSYSDMLAAAPKPEDGWYV